MINQNIMATSEYILTHHSLNFYAKHFERCRFVETELLGCLLSRCYSRPLLRKLKDFLVVSFKPSVVE